MKSPRKPVGRRSFDPVAVGRAECAAWTAYYRHEWLVFLRSGLAMVAAGFGMGPIRTLLGAWYVLRANQAWAPYPDNRPGQARACMRRFYQLVLDSGWGELDPAGAAALEVEWWRVHRAHQHGTDTREELVEALDALYSHVYGVPPGTMLAAARLRAEAMDYSDAWVRAGRHPGDLLLTGERRALVASFSALRDAVDRQPIA